MRAPTPEDLALCPDNVQEAYALLRAECEAWREVEAARKRYFDEDYDGPSGIDEAGEMLTKARAATDAAGILKGGES